jgi:hypothetical protein
VTPVCAVVPAGDVHVIVHVPIVSPLSGPIVMLATPLAFTLL